MTPMGFAEQNILENKKLIMVDSYEMDVMNGLVILVKVDEMYNILKSASHCLLIWEIKMELDDESLCWSLPLNIHTFTTSLFY